MGCHPLALLWVKPICGYSTVFCGATFCGFAAKKPKQKHFSGVCNPQSPALQSGKPLNFMRMGGSPANSHAYLS
jgi:hypothetical protein